MSTGNTCLPWTEIHMMQQEGRDRKCFYRSPSGNEMDQTAIKSSCCLAQKLHHSSGGHAICKSINRSIFTSKLGIQHCNRTESAFVCLHCQILQIYRSLDLGPKSATMICMLYKMGAEWIPEASYGVWLRPASISARIVLRQTR